MATNETDKKNAEVLSETVKDFLIEEYKALNDALHITEERGEKRLEFFVTLSTLVVGAIGYSINELYEKQNQEILNAVFLLSVYLLSGLILIGFIVIRRIRKRNKITDGIKLDIQEIRMIMKDDLDPLHKVLPSDYSAFESRSNTKKGGRRIFTSIYDIANIVVAVLVGVLSVVVCIFKNLEFECITLISSFFSLASLIVFITIGYKKSKN